MNQVFTDPDALKYLNKSIEKIYGTGCGHDELHEWLSFPPKFTTVRVDLNLATRDEVMEQLREAFTESDYSKQYRDKKVPVPIVSAHGWMDDVVVVESEGRSSRFNGANEDDESTAVIVGSLCGAALLRGANVYAPGVLGAPLSLRRGQEVQVYVDTANRTLKGATKGFELSTKIFVGKGLSLMSRRDLFKGQDRQEEPVSGVAIKMTECIFDCPSIGDVPSLSGCCMLQNLPSILVGHAMDPVLGERILDMCAAPGGKTAHLASLYRLGMAGDKSLSPEVPPIVAVDKSKAKVAQIRETCARFGLQGFVRPIVADSTKLTTTRSTEVSTDGTGATATSSSDGCFLPESFDKILLDAPCSALGQRPQFRNDSTAKQLASFPKVQRKLMDSAVELLKPSGGVLVYSTCTITVEENEEIVSWALEKYAGVLELEDLGVLSKSIIDRVHQGDEVSGKVLRFGPWPSADLSPSSPDADTIGFFVAKLKKVASTAS